ncbi:hypothetical protein ACFQMA_11120 [Halosimplex aquaticum]|uniref:Lipoprotein n=1 Tax=Halosimplex aquaticum TaxID=3026162 RepID=A0ABD5Y2A0_9EURY|nr:hypothetical protein [Halosimplex aquaticum]
MHGRTRSAVVAVLVAALLAGCGTAVTPPDSVGVDSPGTYAVEDVHVWTSGSTTEYRSQVVVSGNLRSVDATSNVSIPQINVSFALAGGETRTVQAVYELERRQTAYADLGNATLAPDERIPVRAVFDPAEGVTVRNATIHVAA